METHISVGEVHLPQIISGSPSTLQGILSSTKVYVQPKSLKNLKTQIPYFEKAWNIGGHTPVLSPLNSSSLIFPSVFDRGSKLPLNIASSDATNDKADIKQQSPKYYDYLTSLEDAPPSMNIGCLPSYILFPHFVKISKISSGLSHLTSSGLGAPSDFSFSAKYIDCAP